MSGSPRTVTAAVVIIGNEVLSGRTQDRNLAYLAKGLNQVGVQVREARVIPDVDDIIVKTVNALREAHDYVFTTGGIGPTHDDITAEAVARAFGVPLERNAAAVRRLQQHYSRDDIPFELNESRLRMANIPRGADLVDNPVSKAPGFRIGNVFVFAGVPSIMQAMFDGVKHSLAGGVEVKSRELIAYLPEGEIAAALGELQARYRDVDMGSYPFMRSGRFGTSLVLRSGDEARLRAALAELRDIVGGLGGTFEEAPPPG